MIYKIIKLNLLINSVLCLICFNMQAQYTGQVVFEGATYKYHMDQEATPLPGVTITVYKDTSTLKGITSIKSGKKGSFSLNLPYGTDYKIVFSSPGTVRMFLMIYANGMPEKRRDMEVIIDGGMIPNFDTTEKTIDLLKYKFPFNKYVYDGKKSFTEDIKYFDDFQKGMFTEYENAKALIEKQKKQKGKPRILMLSGKLLHGETPGKSLKNIVLELVDEKGTQLQKTTTNNFGKFTFKNVSSDVNFLVRVAGNSLTIPPNSKITIVNRYGEIIMQTISGGKGEFEFKVLESDKSKVQMLEVTDDVLVISGNLMAQIGKSAQPLANTKISLINDKGEVLETVTTNMFGNYVFTNAPADRNFSIKLVDKLSDKMGPIEKIMITDNSGNQISTASGDANSGFKFEFLKSDTASIKMLNIDDSNLKIDFKGKLWSGDAGNSTLSNVKVNLVGPEGKIIQTTTTDDKGGFLFSYLDPMMNYTLQFDSTDAKLKSLKKLTLTDMDDNFIKDVSNSKSALSISLSKNDQKQLSSTYVDDPWLKVAGMTDQGNASGIKMENGFVIPERVYFESGGAAISSQSQKVLDKVAQVMKSNLGVNIEIGAHTDAKGEDNSNLVLSKKRAKAAADYMIAAGIAAQRLTNIGFGETKLLNKCSNGVTCTEEEHGQNRRLEFRIIKK